MSSMRSRKRPRASRAVRWPSKAEWAWPRWRKPVGLGANRVTISAPKARVMAGRNSEDAALLQQALDHLAENDRHMAAAIAEIGAPPPRYRPAGFATLMDVIVAQQVSTASARAISGRLTDRLSKVTPEGFIALTDADLRAVGFSRQKTLYGRDLAAAFMDGRVSLAKLRRMDDEGGIASPSAV